MYLIQLGPVTYRRPFSLVAAMREVYGTGQARILRTDGTVAVERAGSASEVVHAPTGRTVRRRPTRPARLANVRAYCHRPVRPHELAPDGLTVACGGTLTPRGVCALPHRP